MATRSVFSTKEIDYTSVRFDNKCSKCKMFPNSGLVRKAFLVTLCSFQLQYPCDQMYTGKFEQTKMSPGNQCTRRPIQHILLLFSGFFRLSQKRYKWTAFQPSRYRLIDSKHQYSCRYKRVAVKTAHVHKSICGSLTQARRSPLYSLCAFDFTVQLRQETNFYW